LQDEEHGARAFGEEPVVEDAQPLDELGQALEALLLGRSEPRPGVAPVEMRWRSRFDQQLPYVIGRRRGDAVLY
jgi:hypothetical protein